MSDLLNDFKTEKSASEKSATPVSLEELLIRDNVLPQEGDEEAPSSLPESVSSSSSRRARRKKLKSTRIVDRTKDNKQSRVQDKANRDRQEKNVNNLIKRKKQTPTSKEVAKAEFIGSPRGKLKKQPVSSQESTTSVIRPVMMGSLEFEPVWDAGWTENGELLRLKRGARMMKIDKQVDIDIGDLELTELPLTNALEEYTKASKKFRLSLSPENIKMYEEALTAFGLSISEGASASEVLYTLISEYRNGLKSSTARLDESSDRDIEPGTSLIGQKDERIENYVSSLRGTDRYCYDNLVTYDDSDIEVSLKCMVSLLSKEVLLSYNAIKSNSDNDSSNDVEITTKWATNLLMAKQNKNALSSPAFIESKGKLTDKTAHGIAFKNRRKGINTLNYPFELAQVVSPADIPVMTSLDFIDKAQSDSQVYYGVDSTGALAEYSNPYEVTSAGLARANEQIKRLFDTSGIGREDIYAVSFLRNILEWMSTAAFVAKSVTNVMISLQTLVEAAENKNMLDDLMIYLAFRQERLQDYDGTGLPPSGPSSIVRSSVRLRKKLGNISSRKRKTTFTQKPRKVTVSPQSDGSPGSETFNSPAKKTSITTEDTASGEDAGTLESIFDTSFEEISGVLSEALINRFRSNIGPLTADPSLTSVIDEETIRSSIASLTTVVFNQLINHIQAIQYGMDKIDNEQPEIFQDRRSVLNRYNENAFSSMYILTCCKLAKLLMGSRSTITLPNSTLKYSTAKVAKKTYSSVSSTVDLATKTYDAKISTGATTSTSSPQMNIELTSSYLSDIQVIAEYFNSDERDTSDIIDTHPILASVIAAVAEEEEFLSSFAESMSSFFANVSSSFKSVADVLQTKVGDITLSEFMKSSKSSPDMVKLLKTYPYSMNTKDTIYNKVKVRDKVTSKVGFRLLENVMKTGTLEQKKQHVLCVALPVGLIERTRYEPAEIEDISSFSEPEDSIESLFVIIEKVDLANPEVRYKDLEFEFSRNLFCLGADPWSSYLEVNDDFSCTKLNRDEAVKKFGEDVVKNHLSDFVLKMYADLQLDLDFFESSFTVGQNPTAQVIEVPALKNVDTSTETFLSASNLAYDPSSRTMTDMKFYEAGLISLDKVDLTDKYQYSVLEYLNSYGARFVPESEKRRLNKGLMFEKIICVPIDDDLFELELDDVELDPEISSEISVVKAIDSSQKEVGIGLETSQGVSMFTYRASIRVGKEA